MGYRNNPAVLRQQKVNGHMKRHLQRKDLRRMVLQRRVELAPHIEMWSASRIGQFSHSDNAVDQDLRFAALICWLLRAFYVFQRRQTSQTFVAKILIR